MIAVEDEWHYSRLQMLPSTMESQSPPSGYGPAMNKSLSNELAMVITDTSSNKMLLNEKKTTQVMHYQDILSTLESRLKNNKPILNDNQVGCKSDILDTNSLLILDQESTTRDQALKPFWKPSLKETSSKLWLPTKTDSPGLDLISSHGFSLNLEQNLLLWKTNQPLEIPPLNLLKTSWKSLQSFPLATMDDGSILCTRKLRFFPNKAQTLLFNKCFRAHRYCYNNAVQEINNRFDTKKDKMNTHVGCCHKDCKNERHKGSWFCDQHTKDKVKWDLNVTLPSIRNASMQTDKNLPHGSWLREVPFDTRGHGVQDAVSAYKTCITNKSKGNIQQFKLRFKSMKDPSQIFWIDNSAIKQSDSEIKLFVRRLKHKSALRFRPKDRTWLKNNKIDNDAKIQREGNGQFYLIVNFKRRVEVTSKPAIVASLDPGTRTFQTMYSEAGIIGKIGGKTSIQVKQLHSKIDHLRSLRSKVSKRKKRNVRYRELRLHKKLRDVVSNLHNQTASYLSKNYQKVLLPEFGTSKLVTNANLASSVKREMLSYRFYQFKTKLQHLCHLSGSELTIVCEAYTTRTCTQCGVINNNVGCAKVFKCCNPECCIEVDRDINGARNILLKRLS